MLKVVLYSNNIIIIIYQRIYFLFFLNIQLFKVNVQKKILIYSLGINENLESKNFIEKIEGSMLEKIVYYGKGKVLVVFKISFILF